MSIGNEIAEVFNSHFNQELAAAMESFAQRALALEDMGWDKLGGETLDDSAGLSLDSLKTISLDLQGAVSNPLHKRGAQLRHAYVFGRGVQLNKLEPRTEKFVSDPYVKEMLLSVGAYETMNLARFTDGIFSVIINEVTQTPTILPLQQITGVITDPDDDMKIRYFKRSWSSNGEQREMWFPVSRFKKTIVGRGKRGPGLPKTIKDETVDQRVPVSQDSVVYFSMSSRFPGNVFGIPDSLAAKVWTVAYSKALKNSSGLMEALQQVAWKITAASNTGVDNAAMQIGRPGIGGTAVTGSANDLQPVGVPSSQVNFDNSQPLAAMVATSFGVPVIALLSSPGAGAGSYGTAQTLDGPTIKGMRAVQDSWIVFFQEILSDMGSPNVEVVFPSLEEDPAYRHINSLATLAELGAIWPDEIRENGMAVMDIQKLHDGPPPRPKEIPNASSGQGRQGAGRGGVEQGETNHEPDSE